jgi:hypothetical protein
VGNVLANDKKITSLIKMLFLCITIFLLNNSISYALDPPVVCYGSTGYYLIQGVYSTATDAANARDGFCGGCPGHGHGNFKCTSGWSFYYCHCNNADANCFLYPNNSTCQVSTDTDNDGICNENDNCPNIANLDQADQDLNGTGDVCDIKNSLLPAKFTIFHNEPINIVAKCSDDNINWTITTDDGVAIKPTTLSNSVNITALSGHGNIYITSQSNEDPECNDTTIVSVGCDGTCGNCQNINLGGD